MRQILVICASLVLLGGVFVSLAAAMSDPSPSQRTEDAPALQRLRVTRTGDAFLTALKAADYTAAYSLLAPNLRQEFGAAEGLATLMEIPGAKPALWSFDTTALQDDGGALEGTVTYADQRHGTVLLTVRPNRDAWQVSDFWFR